MAAETSAALQFRGVTKTFTEAEPAGRTVLSGLDWKLARGEISALVGRSGSGKSTLLHLAAGISVATSGAVLLDGVDLGPLSERERTVIRREKVGLVFQFFHLLSHLSVLENVALPGWIAGVAGDDARRRGLELLDRCGLADRAGDPVGLLSGGEMQRVALCRALLRRPSLILADEPTGSLDDATGAQVMDLLLELAREQGATLLYVTHSRELAGRADRVWRLVGGAVEPEIPA